MKAFAIFCGIVAAVYFGMRKDHSDDSSRPSRVANIEAAAAVVEAEIPAVPDSAQAVTKPAKRTEQAIMATKAVPVVSPDGSQEEILRAAAAKYRVPEGALYGIWSVESRRLAGGWGTPQQSWVRAADMPVTGSECHKQADKVGLGGSGGGLAWCQKQWRALQRLCSQRRAGQPICDPKEVRSSWALALGPMQHVSGYTLAERKDGKLAWDSRVVDFDGDGVIDPHSLADAMGMAAKFLRLKFDESGSWTWAVNKYYGSQTAGYFAGFPNGDPGVAHYWREWCVRTGDCRPTRKPVALAQIE